MRPYPRPAWSAEETDNSPPRRRSQLLQGREVRDGRPAGRSAALCRQQPRQSLGRVRCGGEASAGDRGHHPAASRLFEIGLPSVPCCGNDAMVLVTPCWLILSRDSVGRGASGARCGSKAFSTKIRESNSFFDKLERVAVPRATRCAIRHWQCCSKTILVGHYRQRGRRR
jgi:hypothetical protein